MSSPKKQVTSIFLVAAVLACCGVSFLTQEAVGQTPDELRRQDKQRLHEQASALGTPQLWEGKRDSLDAASEASSLRKQKKQQLLDRAAASGASQLREGKHDGLGAASAAGPCPIPPCNFCWIGNPDFENNCPIQWFGTDDGCDCGCQWTDPDCGTIATCGDGVCDPAVGETCASCASDCGPCPTTCPGFGDCCVGNGTPSCDDDLCCSTVCAADPFCCNTDWDSVCADAAAQLCGGLCGGSCGDGFCDSAIGETCSTCEADCGPCGGSCCCPDLVCLDGVASAECTDSGCVFRTSSCAQQSCPCDSFAEPCDWCWVGTAFENNCPLEWNGGADGCDCGCQFTDLDCTSACGDGVCDSAIGETSTTCPEDCGPLCPGTGDCCVGNGTPGCDNETCCDLVCTADPFCCTGEWDIICVDEAVQLCGGMCNTDCGDGACDPTVGETCTSCEADCGSCGGSCCCPDLACFDGIASTECTEAGCVFRTSTCAQQACPCDDSAEPCDWCWLGTSFDNNCPPEWNGGADGCDCGCQFTDLDCNSACGNGFCDIGETCGTCPADCGICPSTCPGTGDCCAGTGTPGCDDTTCCTTVCTADSFCCDVEWDEICADLAAQLCGGKCPVNACCWDSACETPSVCGVQTHLCSAECLCFEVAEGGTSCIVNGECATSAPCPGGSSDCPQGQLCYINTCCEGPVCAPDCGSVPPGGAAGTGGDGMTLIGVRSSLQGADVASRGPATMCSDIRPASCLDFGGTPQGLGTTCVDPDICGNDCGPAHLDVAALAGTDYPCDSTLSRNGNNDLRFEFDLPVAAPLPGEVQINQMLAPGVFGPDLSALFDITVLGGNVLRIRELGNVFVNQTWYAIRNPCTWPSAAEFEVDYAVSMGDADGFGGTGFSDLAAIFNVIQGGPPPGSLAKNSRYDIDTLGGIGFADLSAAFNFIPSSPGPKPGLPGCLP